MTAEPDVSVLIPVLDEERHLPGAIAAMRAQDLGDRTMELLFVDGRSQDRTRAILEEAARDDPRIRVLDNPQRNIPAGLNVGLRHARGRYVARMDAHTLFPPRYLAAGIERLEADDADPVSWVSGLVIPRPNGGWSGGVTLALGTRLGVGGSDKWRMSTDGPDGAPGEIDLDTGVFAGLWRRSTLEALGGWDEAFPINEDSELAARVLGEGGRIVCLAEMAAEYLPRSTLRGLFRQYGRYGLYRAKTALRHPGSMRRSHLLPPALVVTVALAASPGPLRRPARLGVAVYGAALAASTAASLRRAERPADAARLAVVLPVMHVAWGSGFLAGLVRFARSFGGR